jgi:hypothetical protein
LQRRHEKEQWMRVAVCISGQARNVPVCAGSLVQRLLRGQDCDFFAHTWSQSELHARSTFDEFVAGENRWRRLWKRRQLKRRFGEYLARVAAREESFPNEPEELRASLEAAYHPVRLSIEAQPRFDVARFDRRKQNATVKLEETHPENVLSMFTSIQRACALKSEYEQEMGFVYDCVVRCRSDLFFFGDFCLSDYADRLDQVVVIPQGADFRSGINDQLAFSSSRNMDAYCSTVDFIEPHYRDGGLLHAESILASSLSSKGLELERAPIDYEIVRGQFADAEEFLAARSHSTTTGGADAPSFRNPGTAHVASS